MTEEQVQQQTMRVSTLLHQVVIDNDLQRARQLISDGVNVNAKTESRQNSLHLAVIYGHIDLIEPLLQAGANPNSLDFNGRTPLSLCICRCPKSETHIATLQKIIEFFKTSNKICTDEDTSRKDSDKLCVNRANLFGETALHYAISYGKLTAVKMLVAAGAHINSCTIGTPSPLSMAEEKQNAKIVEFLKAKGAQRMKPTLPPFTRSLPDFVQDAFHKDQRMKEHEHQYGGALWGSCIEVFYTGKKPRSLLAVEAAINLQKRQKTHTWMRGYISSVAPDGKSFRATVGENLNHKGEIKGLQGQWDLTFGWNPNLNSPWMVIEMKKLPSDSPDTVDALQERAIDYERTHGKRFLAHQHSEHCNHGQDNDANQCTIIRGMSADPPSNAKVVTDVNLTMISDDRGPQLRVTYTYANGSTQDINGPHAPMIWKMLGQQLSDHRDHVASSSDLATFRINGEELQLAQLFQCFGIDQAQ
eukprot:TRINITY_DN21834_c0_g1_i1.p1 TRINITY_DN21834_c0_g1~~TRINITY_DN21834_c0_g1_i1.p1  ORF type:complete len:473 (+),score=99.33 TRINITY_DN21834_c0_g1_i1:168-1586(+)